jgi:hypothetical protein
VQKTKEVAIESARIVLNGLTAGFFPGLDTAIYQTGVESSSTQVIDNCVADGMAVHAVHYNRGVA